MAISAGIKQASIKTKKKIYILQLLKKLKLPVFYIIRQYFQTLQ